MVVAQVPVLLGRHGVAGIAADLSVLHRLGDFSCTLSGTA